MGFSPEKIAQLVDPTKPLRWRKVACKSEETGATFIAHVNESRPFPAGRIISLGGYTHPIGITTYRKDGGLVPDGLQILLAGVASPEEGRRILKQDCTIHYLQWRWTEYLQRDTLRYSGKELKRTLVVDDATWNTPWQDGRHGRVEAT
jgi:hypothetical protein